MINVLEKINDYIKLFIPKFKDAKINKPFICPVCNHVDKTAILLPETYSIRCHNPKCKNMIGDITDLVLFFEPEKSHWSKAEIVAYLAKKFNVTYTLQSNNTLLLNYYEKNKFNLVPVSSNKKIPIEKGWTKKDHFDKLEWEDWLNDNLNLGVKTGKMSGITVVDIDQHPTPPEILSLLGDKQTLYQKTTRGAHYFFKYEKDLPKTRIVDLEIDIVNDGGQVIIPPSTIDGKHRKIELFDIQPMPSELKEFLLGKTKNKKSLQPLPEVRPDDKQIDLSDISFSGSIGEGNRHHNFMKFGGLLRKKMNMNSVLYTLTMMNKYLCDPPLKYQELQNICNSIDRYVVFDEKEMSYNILNYIEKVEEASSRDIKEALEYKKEQIDTALAFLVREGYLIRKRRYFKPIKKMKWREEFMDDGKVISYNMPYFNNTAIFREGDLIVIGAKTGVGKCIASGLVASDQGLIDIEELGQEFPMGDSIIDKNKFDNLHLYRGTSNFMAKPIMFLKKEVNKTVKITSYNGYELEGSVEHPILINKDNKKVWIKMGELLGNEEIFISSFPFAKNDKQFLLNNLDYTHNKHNTTNNKNILLPAYLNHELSRLLGYWLADGNFSSTALEISNSRTSIKQDIIEICNKFNLSYRDYGSNIRIFGKDFIHFFTTLIGAKTNIKAREKTIPKVLYKTTKENISHFIRAYIDCDSDLTSNHLCVTSASEKLIKKLQIFLLGFNIFSKINSKYSTKYKHNYWRLSLSRIMTQKYFKQFGTLKYINWEHKCSIPTNPNFKVYNEHLFIDKITDVTIINKKKTVYDFDIPQGHAFWSNGVVSHNSHIAVNIMKRLIDQGVKPKYVNLESANRFLSVAKSLGLSEGEFKWGVEFSPETIELDDNSFTIIDWLLPDNYAETDKIYKYFAEQLARHKGILVVFVQLKADGSFFSPNQIEMFPSLAAKFLYEDDTGEVSCFQVTKVREGKDKNRFKKISTRYDWKSKELLTEEEFLAKHQKINLTPKTTNNLQTLNPDDLDSCF